MKRVYKDDSLLITAHRKIDMAKIKIAINNGIREWEEGKYIYSLRNEFTDVYALERYLKKDCIYDGFAWYVPKVIRIYASETVARVEVLA